MECWGHRQVMHAIVCCSNQHVCRPTVGVILRPADWEGYSAAAGHWEAAAVNSLSCVQG